MLHNSAACPIFILTYEVQADSNIPDVIRGLLARLFFCFFNRIEKARRVIDYFHERNAARALLHRCRPVTIRTVLSVFFCFI